MHFLFWVVFLKVAMLGIIIFIVGAILVTYGFENFSERGIVFWVGLLLIVIGVWILFTKIKGIFKRNKS